MRSAVSQRPTVLGETAEPENNISRPNCGAPLPEMGRAFFSFNKPAGACPACTGLGTVYIANLPRILDAEKSLTDGAVMLWDPLNAARHIETLRAAGRSTALISTRPCKRRLFVPSAA